MWGDESEAVAPIIWLYQIVDAQKEEVFFPEVSTELCRVAWHSEANWVPNKYWDPARYTILILYLYVSGGRFYTDS